MAKPTHNMFDLLPADAADDVLVPTSITWHPNVDSYVLSPISEDYIMSCEPRVQRYLRQMVINFHQVDTNAEVDLHAVDAFLALVPRKLRSQVRWDFNQLTYMRSQHIQGAYPYPDDIYSDCSYGDSAATEQAFWELDRQMEMEQRMRAAGNSY